MKKIIALALAIIMTLGLFAGCGKTNAPATDATSAEEASSVDGTLKLQWFQAIGIDSLFENPWHDQQSLYPYMVFDALVAQESDGTYVPRLASEWTISEDGLTYTFTLREDVVWHDGEAFTADDVVWTLSANCANPNAAYLSHLKYIEGYEAVAAGEAKTLSGVSAEGNVVTIKLATPDNNFLYGIGSCYILPEHLLGEVPYAEVDAYEAYWTKPVGTGIYKIDKVSFPDYFTCVPNDNYFGDKASIKDVLFTSYNAGGNDSVVAALIANELDFAFGNAINDIIVAENVASQNADMVPMLQTSYYTRFLVYNLAGRADGENKTDLQNANIRKALSMLIDKDMVASFYGEAGVGLSTMVNPNSPKYNSDIDLPKRDVEAAVQILKDEGFDFNQTIDIAYYYDDQTTADLMALLVQQLGEGGVKVETSLMTGDLGVQIYETCNYDIIYLAFAGASDPIEMYYHQTSSTPYNFMGQTEERKELYDDLYAKYCASTTAEDMKKYGDALQLVGYENCYAIPMYSLNTIQMYNTAKLDIPEDIFEVDNQLARNWKFAEWTIVQ